MRDYPNIEFGKRYKDTLTYGFWIETAANRSRIESLFQSDSPDWVVLNLNPSEMSVSSPFATDVSIMQGGGKLVEKNGQLIKEVTISGSNGFLPYATNTAQLVPRRPVPGKLVDISLGAEEARVKRSGFLAFHRLKYIFEKYGELSKKRDFVRMHWFNVKDDDFWLIEPETFDYRKGREGPFTYAYTIRFKALRESLASEVPQADRRTAPLSSIPLPFASPGVQQDSRLRAGVQRLSELLNNGSTFVRQTVGEVNHQFQATLSHLGNLLGAVNGVADTGNFVLDTAINILTQGLVTIQDTFNTAERFAPTNVRETLNEFLLEAQNLLIHIQDFLVTAFSDQQGGSARSLARLFIQPKALSGVEGELMSETGTPLQVNPFLSQFGVNQVLDQAVTFGSVQAEFIRDGDTIYSLASRLLGNPDRFYELIALNDLDAPYIVSGTGSKPSNTLSWGDSILIPSDEFSGTGAQANDAPAPSYAGRVSEVTDLSEITDTLKSLPWRENQWAGYTLTLTSGVVYNDGDNERYVVSNTEDVLTLNLPLPLLPEVWDYYTISLEYPDIVRPEEQNDLQAFGTDLLLSFVRKNGTIYADLRADLVLDHRNDLALARKRANFEQSVVLRVNTERGTHPFAPAFGVISTVGRKFTDNTAYLYSYFLRQSFLRDPRVQFAGSTVFTFDGGVMKVDMQVRPSASKRSSTVTVRL